eukprot:476319_1
MTTNFEPLAIVLIIIIVIMVCLIYRCLKRRRATRRNYVMMPMKSPKKPSKRVLAVDKDTKQVFLSGNITASKDIDWINGITSAGKVINISSTNNDSLFSTGDYDGYFTYKKAKHVTETKHPTSIQLQFNHVNYSIIGSGTDAVGDYTICGIYSHHTLRIALHKKYILGTGHSVRRDGTDGNQGHDVQIRLQYNRDEKLFIGSWFITSTVNFTRNHKVIRSQRVTTYGTYAIQLKQPIDNMEGVTIDSHSN